MLSEELTKHLRDLLPKISAGNVVLFLGAGASFDSGGPSGKKLTEDIKKQFPNADQSITDLFEICQDVLESPPYSRNELEDFIRKYLGSLFLTNSHKTLTTINWATIFTTNFDDLIEFAYRTFLTERLKTCQVVASKHFQVSPNDRSKIYIFKLMGSVNSSEESSDNMVLSRGDFNLALTKRRKYFEILADFVKCGTILFLGYSFGDRIVFDIMDDLISIYTIDRLPWCYAAIPGLKLDTKNQHRFFKRKIIPLDIDFKTFFAFLADNQTSSKKTQEEFAYLNLKGQKLEIPWLLFKQSDSFICLNEKITTSANCSKDQFFMGHKDNWNAFLENWDFQRDFYIAKDHKRNFNGKTYSGCLKDRILKELETTNIEENKILLIRGMAGIGKSITLKRIGYDLFNAGLCPVLFLDQTRSCWDFKEISSFIESLNSEYRNQLKNKDHISQIKPVIIIDNAFDDIRNIIQLRDFLTSRGRSFLFIISLRTAELESINFPLKISNNDIYDIAENLALKSEKEKLISHLFNLGYIHSTGNFWDSVIDKQCENSFFVSVYTLVHPSRKPLNEIIKDQFNSLSPISQKAFKYICLFHQFDLPINVELLVRALKCSYNDFISEVIEKDTSKIIFTEVDEKGNLLYQSHHRIIASKTVEYFFGDPEIQKELFIEIFRESNFSNLMERQLCERIITKNLNTTKGCPLFSYDQKAQLFQVICKNNSSRVLFHHWGVLESDRENFELAEDLLKRALETPREVESFRGESDQNILTSIGVLYSRKGLTLVNDDLKKADLCFKDAAAYFQNAKHGEFPNAHAYHSHANMFFSLGRSAKNDVEKFKHWGEALAIIASSKDNLNESNLQPLYELESKIWQSLGNEEEVAAVLTKLKEAFNSSRGYYLIAEMIFRQSDELKSVELEIKCERALEKIDEGLKYFPKDEDCLRLKCKILKEKQNVKLADYYETLQNWRNNSTIPNAWLLFELGRVAFIMGYYEDSKKFFSELEKGVGLGLVSRSQGKEPIQENGKNVVFEGTIVNFDTMVDGKIRCDSLRNLRHPIVFRPISCRFTPKVNDQVMFNIEFSFRGPRAENITKK